MPALPGAGLRERLTAIWKGRSDRHSEERLEAILTERGYRPDERPKLEMIRLGG